MCEPTQRLSRMRSGRVLCGGARDVIKAPVTDGPVRENLLRVARVIGADDVGDRGERRRPVDIEHDEAECGRRTEITIGNADDYAIRTRTLERGLSSDAAAPRLD
jgi:hypothetical protein